MAKLTDKQRMLLSMAAAREDGAATVPAKIRKPAAAKIAAGLVSRKLLRVTRAKPGMPVWREGDDGRGLSLVITRAGLDAIGVKAATKRAEKLDNTRGGTTQDMRAQPRRSLRPHRPAAEVSPHREPDCASAASFAPRAGTKLALVINMLEKQEGATIAALVGATGWQPHTARAVLTGLRKSGLVIERTREDGATSSVYRVAAPADHAA